jgi:integrase
MRRFLVAAREAGDLVHACYATALYTGMRLGELAALRWEDVDFERRLVCVQRSHHDPRPSSCANRASLR